MNQVDTAPRPNILFIMTDQQHARMMSCAGNACLKTPAMDSLAEKGIRFEKAYCTNPVCAPSRISMVTGMMSCRLGADDNAMSKQIEALPPEVVASSMGNAMKQAGYDTFYGGKIHLCKGLEPLEAGYDEFFADERGALPAACVDFIQRDREKPFFAVASFINPHDICFAHRALNGVNTQDVIKLREEALRLPEDALPTLPENYAIPETESPAILANLDPDAITPAPTMRREYDEKEWRINRWIYHRLTERVDREIGEILDGLREAGLEEDTLVIFTSDHGNMDASHRLASKSAPYEESVGVPFILQYGGRIPAGQVDGENPVSSGLDILPTLYDYAGLPKPDHLLGQSLRPLAEAGRADDRRPYVPSENDWFRMIRSRQYKYCAFSGGEEMLVDLEADPGEMENLASNPQYEAQLAEHRALFADWSRLSGDKSSGNYGHKSGLPV